VPLKVFDDGTVTYFRFATGTDLPAIFAIDRDGKETTVNLAARGDYFVADRLAQAFVLRRGGDVTRIINEKFVAADPAATTLKPWTKSARKKRQQAKP
jgi:type IV secretion system protein VirB9